MTTAAIAFEIWCRAMFFIVTDSLTFDRLSNLYTNAVKLISAGSTLIKLLNATVCHFCHWNKYAQVEAEEVACTPDMMSIFICWGSTPVWINLEQRFLCVDGNSAFIITKQSNFKCFYFQSSTSWDYFRMQQILLLLFIIVIIICINIEWNTLTNT